MGSRVIGDLSQSGHVMPVEAVHKLNTTRSKLTIKLNWKNINNFPFNSWIEHYFDLWSLALNILVHKISWVSIFNRGIYYTFRSPPLPYLYIEFLTLKDTFLIRLSRFSSSLLFNFFHHTLSFHCFPKKPPPPPPP